ncbi:MAG TPA: SprT family zinc-dependent metalloprotease [Anaerolineaceae bacterium]|mgnify:CR=1 FL=1|nr:SprT family zinc-dependent metalloprotease [Anaerolineaceae bacterium]
MTDTIEAITLISGRKVSYFIRQSNRARRLRITVSSDGVMVTLPKGTRPAAAERFLQQNSDWLLAQLEKVDRMEKKARSLPQDVIYYRGVPVRIKVIEEPGRSSRMRVDKVEDGLVVRVPVGTRAKPRVLAESWLKAQARAELETMLRQQAARMKVSPKKLTIRDQRTRWGSCSTRGTISLSWRLIMAPPQVLQYVVIHELAHLVQPNHSPAFWQVVTRYAPDWKTSRAWLHKHAPQLRPDNS